MSESVHGHEVMQMMLEHDGLFTRESLIHAVENRFGSHCRYHNCQRDDMSLEQLIDLLETKGKLIIEPDGFTTSRDKICQTAQ